MLKETPDGVIIPIKVIPKAHRNEIVGWENAEIKVKIRAVPEKGSANDALLRFLAKHLGVPPSSVTLLAGKTSRHKRVCVRGLPLQQAALKLPAS